jgi:DNA (cytosine-5)-methyltransferase 1
VDVPEKGWPTSGCFYDEMGKWSVAWRVLDAQFWGTSDKPLPQRRRRIALVADFGGLSASEILFVRKSVSGDLEPGEQKGKEAPRDARESSGGAIPYTLKIRSGVEVDSGGRAAGKGALIQTDKTGTLSTVQDQYLFQPVYGFDPQACRDVGQYVVENMANTLTNGTNPGWHNGVCYSIDQGGGKSPVGTYEGVSPTLTRTNDGAPAVAYTYDARGNGDGQRCATLTGDHQNRVTDYTSVVLEPIGINGDKTGTLDASYYKGCGFREGKERDVVFQPVVSIDRAFFNQGQNALYEPQYYEDGTVPTLVAKGPAAVQIKHIVRRLTPLECERLQGYPDGWTDIGEWIDTKGKKHKEADSPRYKALGNSIALPPWKWVLKRLCACYERDATMASLFDGIGGFPLIWEQLNGNGSCLWASEIEEFPMAVTKVRFGE